MMSLFRRFVPGTFSGPKADGSARWGFMGITEIPDHDDPSKVYLWRLRIVEAPYFGVKLHHIRMSDNPETRGLHDHPWSFLSIRLRRNYTELRPGPLFESPVPEDSRSESYPQTLKTLSGVQAGLHFRTYITKCRRHWSFTRGTDLHAVRLDDAERGCWTLVLNGPRRREWGFRFPGGEWMPWHQLDGAHARNVRGNAGSVKP